ncbi:glycerophosphodiester phosphodiesterase family protein [Sphingobacterium spiritivorum]|uniref:glycerophosphodiester phosphodiesterase family protein n=1 Tax=Sphingobacterium spiritivorum TaxID=258 RepID=UPI00191A1730|nr:glycerophosphodiester phosphodiesterase family protein [Sphingobacterium spiritivorum]QQT25340.1 glycerophosphodiester phosphodiesterase family protein [Sphingobacterium spiritivorum]
MNAYIKTTVLLLLLVFNNSGSAFAQPSAMLDKLAPDHIHIAAHRGAHRTAPENSIAAIEEAIRLGVTFVELDIRSTKDGVLILMHDKTLDRTTTGNGKVSSKTYAEIQQLYLRETAHGEAGRHRIPTLEEALKACKGKIVMDIDFKEERKEFMQKTYELIRQQEMEDEVMFFLYDHLDMHALHKLNPKITLFPRARNMEDLKEILKSGLTHIIHIDESFTDKDYLNEQKKKGVFFWINSLGETDDKASQNGIAVYRDFIQRYPFVRVVQTDDPGLWNKL